jgi:hypothetical protein
LARGDVIPEILDITLHKISILPSEHRFCWKLIRCLRHGVAGPNIFARDALKFWQVVVMIHLGFITICRGILVDMGAFGDQVIFPSVAAVRETIVSVVFECQKLR